MDPGVVGRAGSGRAGNGTRDPSFFSAVQLLLYVEVFRTRFVVNAQDRIEKIWFERRLRDLDKLVELLAPG